MENSESYPEWPEGLGDPGVALQGAALGLPLTTTACPKVIDPRVALQGAAPGLPLTITARQKVIAQFRTRQDAATTGKAPVLRKRPHLRHFQGIRFPSRRCSFQFHCRAGLATKQCHSCAKFDETQLGYYCDTCFTARHPAYRLPHSWSPIEDATNQEEDWVSHVTRHHLEQDAAELKLLLSGTQAFLAHSSSSFPGESVQPRGIARVLQPASSPIDFKQAFATAATIQGTLRGLLEQIHAQLEQKPPLTHEEALAKIQSMWKLRKARKQLKALVGEVYASFQDPTTGQTYYYNKQTRQTQWTKPLALRTGSLPAANPNAAPRKAKPATKVFASREEQELHAVAKLQAMARTHVARRHMRKLISSVYEKIWDAGTQRFYYHNTKTKEVKWEKPRWVNDEDLPTPRARYEQLQRELARQAEAEQEARREQRRAEKPLSQGEAARMVQRAYRRKTGFQNLLKLCRAVYERIYDPETQRFYYHNTRTKETTWEKPLLLRGAQSDVFTPRTRETKLHTLMAAMDGRKLRVWTEEEAATRLQGLYRAKKAKEELGVKLAQRFKQAIDPSSGQAYYVDLLTQEVSWDPPALLLRAHVQIETFE